MQTFLPKASFVMSAKTLDYRRLGKQRVEVLQILNVLFGKKKGWSSHPAVKMWKGSEKLLIQYGLAICQEWIDRGYKDTCYQKIESFKELLRKGVHDNWPKFLGNEAFHRSHVSNLLRKDPEYYGRFFTGVPNNLEYIWMV